ncbi:MAG: N-acetylmuramoyl-L-alanine amidase family protein [Cyclonatronaceae bacterium]
MKIHNRQADLFSTGIIRFGLLLFAIISALPLLCDAAFAQIKLERISVATRSDGKGYVIRLHLNSAPARFSVIQPETDLLQFTFNGVSVAHSDLKPEPVAPVKEFVITESPEGTGIDIRLNDNEYYLARTYLDANNRHVLIALTRTNANEIVSLAERTEIIRRGNFTASIPEPDTLSFYTPDPEDAFDRLFNQRQALKFEVIVIDPGHGGREPGSIGTRGTREKDVTLQVAKRIGAYINEFLPELKVVYTREDDRFVDLDERGRIGNRAQGDLFISIHANSVRSRNAYGTEVWILGMHRTQEAFEVMKRENSVIRFEDKDESAVELTQEQLMIYELANSGNMASSAYFAGLLDHQFSQRAGRRSRGVKQAGFQVLYHASMPAVLVELGFISNPNEERFITSDYGQSILASAIFRAVRDYKEQIERSQKERNISR